MPTLGAPVLELLAPKAGERILDLGCGNGVLTDQLRTAGAHVVAVDADPAMVEAAVARGIDARLMDGQALTFDGEFDAVFTNAALHWMPQPARVAAGMLRALKPGGRYVGELGGRGNIAAIRTAVRAVLIRRGYAPPARDPQWYPDPSEFRSVHSGTGFVVEQADLLYRPTPLPTGMAPWLSTFRTGSFEDAGVPSAERTSVVADIVELLRPVLSDRDGIWIADYVRLRFTARRAE